VIGPALAAGKSVLCDRFSDSTRVYQGVAGAVGLELVDRLHRTIFGDLAPDLTLILDLPAAVGLARRRAGRSDNRFERKPLAYHERVREGFLALARAEPARCLVVDANRAEAAVGESIRVAVGRRFGLDLTAGG
jgi:dTMP kinase